MSKKGVYIMKKWFVCILLVSLLCGCAETPHLNHEQELTLYEIRKDHPFGWIERQHVRLTDRELDEIARYGVIIGADERTVVYYSMTRRRGRGEIGKAFLVKGKGEHGHFELVVDIDGNRIQEIHIVKNPFDCTGQSVINEDFIEQFIGKELTDSFELARASEDVLTTPNKIKPIKMAPITSEMIAKELRKWLVIDKILNRNYPIWSTY
ncbi:MAG TPA: hypothetical protein ACFYD9_09590 [Candidatus Wunengus sp. YC64]|uniref:hypothetical protein n=1 Tax=Candidatus Wunengus sp. YC64 TaxID=3367700 RepID=UPI002713A48F|nr:hypothetical protein [Candidatus Brocadiales bacterium]